MTLDRRRFAIGTAAFLAAPAVIGTARAAEGPFSLPDLGYAPGDLEPTIGTRIMELHHGKHHAGYVKGLNAAVSDGGIETDLEGLPNLLADLDRVPEAVRTKVRQTGGGHANHTMFWQVMSPDPGDASQELQQAIADGFGSMEEMRAQFEKAGKARFGSGWVFVTVDETGGLQVEDRANQDTPLMDGRRVLLGNDVWEHAYYLTYENRRGEYLSQWWTVVDWAAVSDRYAMAKSGELGI